MDPSKKKKPQPLFFSPLPRTPTIFHNHVDRNQLLDELDASKKVKRVISGDVAMIAGPKGEEWIPEEYSQSFALVSSLYPLNVKTNTREGDPVCDSYRVHTSESGSVWCIADGCNWGNRPFQAANRARDAFIAHTQSKINECKNVKEIGSLLLNAVASAHFTTFHDKADPFMAGTTTLLGGVIARLDSVTTPEMQDGLFVEESEQWTVVAVTIGDCKLFLYSADTKNISDLTATNREEVEDAKDPGGRIGPYLGEGDPDLRNLAFLNCDMSSGDILIAVSDGVHDNLDPATLGLTPADLGMSAEKFPDWKTMPKDTACQTRTNYMCSILRGLIGKLPKPNPALVAKSIVQHCQKITERSRDWMEQNPEGILATQSYKDYPGKMDHCTCVAIRIGKPHSGDYKSQALKPDVFPY